MRIIYMGTPDFAVPALCALHDAGHEVLFAVTKPDAPAGRGKKLKACPVKLKAEELGIPVLSPEKVKGNEEFYDAVNSAAADLIVVAAYGKILPKEVLGAPRLGCVNIHGSLLPKYRGAAPIQRAVLERAEVTGVTLMYMAEGMDTGDMIAKAETPVAEKTADGLFAELAQLGAQLLMQQLPLIENGTAARVPQNDAEATYAPMVSKEDCILRFENCPEDEAARVRALGGITLLNGETFKVHAAHAEDSSCVLPAGTVARADKHGIAVSCGGKLLVLTNVQAPGKKAMDVSAFLLGNKIEIGTVLG